MDKYCSNCGTELAEGASSCPLCGRAVSGEADSPAPAGEASPQTGEARLAASEGGERSSVPASKSGKHIRWALGIAALLFMGLIGVFNLGLSFLGYGPFLVVGMVLALLPLPLYIALALWIDRYEKEPLWMLFGAFFWGATVSIFISGIVNTVSGAVVGGAVGSPEVGDLFMAVISAPLIEEGTKGAALLILFFWKTDEFDGVLDGIIYAAMVGLGFAVVENFDYYARSFLDFGAAVGLETFGIRGILAPFAHPLFTSMLGIGLGLARQSRSGLVKFGAPVAGLAAGILLHAVWNLSASLGFFFLSYFVVMVPAFLGLLLIIAFSLRREGRIVRHNLTPELHSGVLTQGEYDSLTSVRGRLAASLRAMGGGPGRWRARSRFSQIASELAFHRDRVHRGITSENDAAREAAYLRRLRELKAAHSA